MKPNHVMIDLETMGLFPGCAIVSIGAVVFDPRGNIVTKSTFYREFDYMAQVNEGLKLDESVLAWWEDQSPKVREALCGLDDLKTELKEFTKWLPQDCKVWGNGPTFDISMLEYCYQLYGLTIPWKYWNIRDCRTIRDMYESVRGGLNTKSGGDKHNALSDAVHQAEYVCQIWKSLLGGKK